MTLSVSPNSLINFAALSNASVNNEPFPYTIISSFLNVEHINALVEAFPKIKNRGSIPAQSVVSQPLFQALIKELEGPLLRTIIAEKFSIELENKPTMLTLRGHTTKRDGFIHTDSRSKLITLLLYMNSTWEHETGELCLLRNKNSLENPVARITPKAGNCLIFKVTPNCWHGHHPFVGKRLSIQLNYLSGEAALNKHLNHHRLTAWIKNKLSKFTPNSNETY